ncbi:hypothetical protein ACQ7B4_19585, partial [Escherichia coli]
LRCGHCQSDLLKAAGLARSTLYYQLSLQKAKDKYADVKQLIASIFHTPPTCYSSPPPHPPPPTPPPP